MYLIDKFLEKKFMTDFANADVSLAETLVVFFLIHSFLNNEVP